MRYVYDLSVKSAPPARNEQRFNIRLWSLRPYIPLRKSREERYSFARARARARAIITLGSIAETVKISQLLRPIECGALSDFLDIA